MATIGELNKTGQLIKMKGSLGPHQVPMRLMYASPCAVDWMKTTLPTLTSDGFHCGAATPREQALSIVHDYTVGRDLSGDLEPHIMKPEDHGIWSIRTHDLRLYGWFYEKAIFILAAIEEKQELKENPSKYDAAVSKCVKFRDELDLDEPKTIFGSWDDVCGD